MRLRRRHIGRNRPHRSHRWILKWVLVRKTGVERARPSHGRSVFRTQHHLVNRTIWTRPKRESKCVGKVAFHLSYLLAEFAPVGARFEPRTPTLGESDQLRGTCS